MYLYRAKTRGTNKSVPESKVIAPYTVLWIYSYNIKAETFLAKQQIIWQYLYLSKGLITDRYQKKGLSSKIKTYTGNFLSHHSLPIFVKLALLLCNIIQSPFIWRSFSLQITSYPQNSYLMQEWWTSFPEGLWKLGFACSNFCKKTSDEIIPFPVWATQNILVKIYTDTSRHCSASYFSVSLLWR